MSFQEDHLYFDDLAVGQEWESGSRMITEYDVGAFAGLSGDNNPLHLDEEYASATPYRRPVAHGLLALSAASGLSQQAPPVRTLAFLELRQWNFLAPVFPGDSVCVRSKVLEKAVRGVGKRGVITWRQQVVNQEGRVVQEGIALTLVEGKAARRNVLRQGRTSQAA